MVGIGHDFPLCMQHQVANLSGTLDGTPPIDLGAVVNGPNGEDNFEGGLGGFQDGMRHCTAASRRLDRFDGQGSRYVDDVRAWQTDEPALDMTGAAILAGGRPSSAVHRRRCTDRAATGEARHPAGCCAASTTGPPSTCCSSTARCPAPGSASSPGCPSRPPPSC